MFADDRYLLLPTHFSNIAHLWHALAVADTHIALDRAVALQNDVQIDRFINEYEIVNRDEPDSGKHFRLFTVLREAPSKLYCVPDSAFQIAYRGHLGVFYLEQDRARSGARQVCAKKINGYRALAQRQLHRRHFPTTTLDRFTVLCVTPNPNRRNALRRAFDGKTGSELWKFVAQTDIAPETFLFEPILYPTVGDAVPIVKRDSAREKESA
jgi:hypothetical protein